MQTVARLRNAGEAEVTISVTTKLDNWGKIAETIAGAKEDHWHPAEEFRREIREYGPDAEREGA